MIRFIILLFVFLIFICVTQMHEDLKAWRKEYDQRQESTGWTPRSIPVCDKELWERIKDGCPDYERED